MAPTVFIVTKPEMLRRIRHILNDLKGITAKSKFLGEETAELEFVISEVEVSLAKLIDDYMAAQYERHNRSKRRQYET